MADKRLLIDRQGTVAMTLAEDAGGRMIARGEFGKADVPTENKRVYPRKIWESQIARVTQEMNEGKILGELDHPADGKTSVKRASHLMRRLWIEDDGRVMGEAVILDNDYGKQLKSIFDAGGQVGVSSRGMGSTRMSEGGIEIVEDDYSYMTHDFVADPAVKSSYPKVTVEQVAATESIEKKVNPVVESNPAILKENVMEKMLTEEQVAKQLNEATEALKKTFEDSLTEKAALMRESIEKSVRAELMTAPELVGAKASLEQIVAAVKPFIVKEDRDEAMVALQKENAELKVQLEGKVKEIAEMEKAAVEIVEGSKRMGLSIFFERAMSKDEDRVEISEMIGDLKQYADEKSLEEAIKKAKDKAAEKKKAALEKKKMKEDADAKTNAKIKALEEQNAKTNRALEESLSKEKSLAAKIYLEERIKGNPNARLIRKLAEGVVEKRKIDNIVKENAVAVGNGTVYNSVNERLARLDAVRADKDKKIVEDQLAEANGKSKSKEVTVEDVDAEIAQVTG